MLLAISMIGTAEAFNLGRKWDHESEMLYRSIGCDCALHYLSGSAWTRQCWRISWIPARADAGPPNSTIRFQESCQMFPVRRIMRYYRPPNRLVLIRFHLRPFTRVQSGRRDQRNYRR
jgi:hypothetical protein